MVDTLTIGSPIFGRLAERVVLVPYVRRLFRQRNDHLLTTLDAAPGTDPQLPTWPADESSPFRRSEVSALIGRGDESWDRATRDVLRWKVKTRSVHDTFTEAFLSAHQIWGGPVPGDGDAYVRVGRRPGGSWA